MLNQITLIGRLTKDPKIIYSKNKETAILNFNLIVQKGKDSTNVVPCTVFNKQAETMAKYLKKGSLISVQGSMEVQHYEGKTYTKVLVRVVKFLSKLDKTKTDYDFDSKYNAMFEKVRKSKGIGTDYDNF